MFLSDHFISVSQDFSTFKNKTPAPWFKKDIHVRGDMKKAEITVCGLGFYELFLNDKRITKGFLSPYITNSDDVVFYDHYDITEWIAVGKMNLSFCSAMVCRMLSADICGILIRLLFALCQNFPLQ